MSEVIIFIRYYDETMKLINSRNWTSNTTDLMRKEVEIKLYYLLSKKTERFE